jgi:RNA polymerase sigma-70 factor (ECF subfamily)
MLFFSLDMEKKPDVFLESCIGKIAEGDKDALGVLFECTKSAVYGFALSITRNSEDAEDVLQDVFVSIYTHAQSYRRIGKPMAWILTIARNLSLMKMRERKKTADISEDDWERFVADDGRLTNDDKIVLTAALRAITPEESQIVMLHAVAGFKHREIAELLELPLSTVLSKYNRAIRKLKSFMEEGNGRAEQRY